MKKIIAILLLISFSLVAFSGVSERVPTPSIENFAVLKTRSNDSYIKLYFDRPVDRVFVNWLGYNEVPEEVTLDSNNQATVSTAGHKYMPGVPYNNAGRVLCKDSYEFVPLPANDCPPTTQAIIDEYKNRTDVKVIQIVPPQKVTVTRENGSYIDLMDGFIVILPIRSTKAIATPDQVAYITVQGEWVVTYSRNGTLLDIIYNKNF